MTVQEAYKTLLFQLYEIYDNREAANITNIVIEHITEFSKIDRIINRNYLFSSSQEKQLNEITRRLLDFVPIQYITNECWFGGLKLYVDENVLIPRPETEELVEWITSDINNKAPRILDIGSGSGCIPILLKKKITDSSITSIDVSDTALKVALKNAQQQSAAIEFLHINFLEEGNWHNLKKFDVIISNPPYIKLSEKESMHLNVVGHEPHTALFVEDNDALIFYKKIAVFAQSHLTPDGKIFVEINESLSDETMQCFKDAGYKTEIKKDLQNKYRMLKVTS
jgi:release factor glutamine methyltransferase